MASGGGSISRPPPEVVTDIGSRGLDYYVSTVRLLDFREVSAKPPGEGDLAIVSFIAGVGVVEDLDDFKPEGAVTAAEVVYIDILPVEGWL